MTLVTIMKEAAFFSSHLNLLEIFVKRMNQGFYRQIATNIYLFRKLSIIRHVNKAIR
jgi:hypothetical protein